MKRYYFRSGSLNPIKWPVEREPRSAADVSETLGFRDWYGCQAENEQEAIRMAKQVSWQSEK